jgi:glycosyltransferase involved in cell wall biosynthesis
MLWLMAARAGLTVAVITFNEQRNLDRCLRSVGWADELLVVDAGSTDRTVAIAERHGARVVRRDWPGFAAQKNFAIEQARHPWVLSLDADEWLSRSCGEEVRGALASGAADAYALRRLTGFSASFLRRTWSRDWQTRLFRRDAGRFEPVPVHESFRTRPGARVGRLRSPLMHVGYRTIAQYVERMNRYTDLAAGGLVLRGERFSVVRLLVSPPAAFVKLYLLRGGWLEGVRGLIVASGSAFYVLLKYAKLWEVGRRPSPEFLRAAGQTPEDPEPGAAAQGETPRADSAQS